MTPKLAAALEAWAHSSVVCNGRQYDDADALRAAYRAALAAPEGTGFKVGDRVRNRDTGEIGPIVGYGYKVEYDGGWALEDSAALDPAPTLPPGHIDRFWVPFAVLVNAEYAQTFIVLNESQMLAWDELSDEAPCFWGKPGIKTGWSFHPDSPVKTEVES